MKRRLQALLIAGFLASAGATGGFAQTLPQGGVVVGGDATITTPDSTRMVVDQLTARGIINWQAFDIGAGNAVEFRQPDSASVTLNRVTGGNPSTILGSLTANGTVMLVNPDGILFGAGATVDVGGLVATTHDLLDSDFMAGHYRFDQSGNPTASIINLGKITANNGGYAALVAPGVRNEGIITARLGKVSLASANRFTLDLYGDDLIKLAVDDAILEEVVDLVTGQPLRTHVDNQGTLSASGGTVAMTAVTARRVVDQVINNDGVLEANSVGLRNGKIVLSAQTAATKLPQAPEQKVRVSGEILAAGSDPGEYGGKVLITGELLRLAHANIDASGASGGGTVLVGGDYLGGRAPDELVELLGIEREAEPIPTASTLYVDGDSSVDVSARTDGNGGKAVFWSDDATLFAGLVSAHGGSASGDGGFVEISGFHGLSYTGSVQASASNGRNGRILFDPQRLTIGSANSLDPDYLPPGVGFVPNPNGAAFLNGTNSEGGMSYIAVDDLMALLADYDVIIYQHPGYRVVNPETFEETAVSDVAQIYIAAPIIAPANGHALTIATAGLGEINLQRSIDFSRASSALTFYSLGGQVSLIPSAGVEIKGGRGDIIFNGLTDVGSKGLPLRVRVVADDGATSANFATCATKGICSDTGTKIDFKRVALSTFDDHFFLQIVSDKFRSVKGTLSLAGIADMLGATEYYSILSKTARKPVISITCYGSGCTREAAAARVGILLKQYAAKASAKAAISVGNAGADTAVSYGGTYSVSSRCGGGICLETGKLSAKASISASRTAAAAGIAVGFAIVELSARKETKDFTVAGVRMSVAATGSAGVGARAGVGAKLGFGGKAKGTFGVRATAGYGLLLGAGFEVSWEK